MNRPWLMVTIALYTTSCDSIGQPISSSLQFRVSIERAEIARGDDFTAALAIENTLSRAVSLTSRCASLASGWVEQDGEDARFLGASSGCFTVIRVYEIGAGDTLKLTWPLRAATIVRQFADGREPETEPAEPDAYVLRVRIDVFEVDSEQVEYGVLEQEFIVR